MFTFKSVLIGLVIMASFMDHVLSQRSPYAGSRPVGYKDRYRPKPNDSDADITNRFGEENLDNQISTTQRPPVASVIVVYGVPEPSNGQGITGTANNVNFQDRFGGSSDIGVGMGGAVNSSPNDGNIAGSRQTTERLPYDARGDEALVNLLNSRPVEQRPFWLVNYQHIEAQRNSSGNNHQTVASRGSFAGKR